ncbi:PF20097 family protein [Butyricicoccus porcorum]|uniref:PF20097 family protein n=1 Tax=Butyricicoccus porcorum TaxID=1945634 RepID=UPI0038B3C48C
MQRWCLLERKRTSYCGPQHWWGKSIKLNEKSIGGPFGGASAEAWLCEKCKKIVIEY